DAVGALGQGDRSPLSQRCLPAPASLAPRGPSLDSAGMVRRHRNRAQWRGRLPWPGLGAAATYAANRLSCLSWALYKKLHVIGAFSWWWIAKLRRDGPGGKP